MEEDIETKVRKLMELWKDVRKESISYSKAEKRIRAAIGSGCPMLDDCTKCGLLRKCPLMNDDKE